MDLTAYKTDSEKEENGQWIDIGEDAMVLVASNKSIAYRKACKKALDKIPDHLAEAKPELVDNAVAKAMGDHILLDWKNLEFDGKKLMPTPENRRKVMLELPAFREVIAGFSTDIANFRAEADAKDGAAVKSGS